MLRIQAVEIVCGGLLASTVLLGNIPRVPAGCQEVDFEFLLGEQLSKQAAGPDVLTWEMLCIAPDRMKETILA